MVYRVGSSVGATELERYLELRAFRGMRMFKLPRRIRIRDTIRVCTTFWDSEGFG